MADKFSLLRADDPGCLGHNLVEWTVGAGELPPETKAVLFNDDGACDLTNQDDSTVSAVPVLKMQPLPVIPKKVTAMASATACYIVT